MLPKFLHNILRLTRDSATDGFRQQPTPGVALCTVWLTAWIHLCNISIDHGQLESTARHLREWGDELFDLRNTAGLALDEKREDAFWLKLWQNDNIFDDDCERWWTARQRTLQMLVEILAWEGRLTSLNM